MSEAAPIADSALAVALLRCTESTLRLTYSPPEVVDQPLFFEGCPTVGTHVLDSLDVIEAMVAVEQEVGVLIVDRTALSAAGTLRGLAGELMERADPRAVDRFRDRWAEVGRYQP